MPASTPTSPLVATNASPNCAAIAEDLAAAKRGTFTGLIITKVGETRGAGAAKRVYGDDTVHAVIITGFSYMSLVERSLAKLQAMTSADFDALVARNYTAYDGRGAKAVQVSVTEQDFKDAYLELVDSYTSTLAGTNTATTDDVYEPLVVNGVTVRGCRVYTGNKTGNPDAAPIGTIYLQGLQIGSKVLVAAANGPVPASKSAAKTVAKNVLRSKLPASRYVSYKLDPASSSYVLNVGGAAAIAADANGVTCDADKIKEVAALLAVGA